VPGASTPAHPKVAANTSAVELLANVIALPKFDHQIAA
jgi:hypothetical protein